MTTKGKKNKSRIMLIIACVLSFCTMGVSLLGAIMIGFNVGGITDALGQMLLEMGYPSPEIDAEISMMLFSFALEVVVELSFALFYLKAIRYKANSVSFAKRLMSKSIWHFILGSILPAIFAMISATMMGRQKMPVEYVNVGTPSNDENKVPDCKLNAMSEAITRLKELKDKGAISEEEYYANLNRILEG